MQRFSHFSAILNDSNLPGAKANNATLQDFFSLLYVIIGALAVLLFVLAGLRYITAQGDPAKLAQAKMRLVHIAIGLVIAALAVTIVNFVVTRFG